MYDASGDSEGLLLNAITESLGGAGMVTGFVMIAEFTDDEGEQRIVCDSMSNQRCHRSMGLLSFGLAVEEARAQDSWRDDDDD